MATANERTTSGVRVQVVVPSLAATAIPPLENGDRLTRAEFHRRYEAMPHVKKAELIEGVVYMASPVNFEQHAEATRIVIGWLSFYIAHTPGVRGGDNSTVLLDADNSPQPDLCLILPSRLGQTKVDADGNLHGGPEFVVEVAATSASYDLHDKLKVYRRNRVREYVVWRTRDQSLDWFAWREGEYVRVSPDATGFHKSEIFPGLWLDAVALLGRDEAACYRTLQRGLASPEHAAFVARLQSSTGNVG